jgi:hypothetical protein
VSYETTELQNKISGFLQFENKTYEAFLYVLSIEGYKITAQIDFGFDELPNFDKKLSELPLEKFKVEDIYAYSTAICKKKYPETNFNFPRIYTEKYSPDSEPWNNFDGYYNDLKKDGTEMRRNYIDENGNIFNINVLHPCPHPIYILKTGFSDAGFELSGDILTDEILQQKWIFSGTEYFSTLTQKRYGLNLSNYDYYGTEMINCKVFNHPSNTPFSNYFPIQFNKYQSAITIEKAGTYNLIGTLKLLDYYTPPYHSFLKIYLNNSLIFEYKSSKNAYSELNFNITINSVSQNSVLRVEARSIHSSSANYDIMKSELIGKALEDLENEGEDNGVITNLNEIDLTRAVPEMTFGDFVNVIKNWFNYDIEISDKTLIMNRIGKDDISGVKDFRFAEIPAPKRTLLNKKSFLLKPVELDNNLKKNSMFYDFSGQKLNGTEKTDTNIIEINGYLMPLKLPKPMGYNTAFVAKDSADVVALVEYSGLKNGQNNATYSSGCDFPELFDRNWLKWLRQRINGQEFNWKFYCNIEKICRFSVKDYVFCYNNIHIIKTLNKEKISDQIYEVEITTETVE